MANEKTKDFKYTLQSKDGKVLLQCIVTFGSEKYPFPKDWENDPQAQIALHDYKTSFIEENFDIKISEDLEFDI